MDSPTRKRNPKRTDAGSASECFAATQDLLALRGNPQDSVPAVHVAGTAGKGSTSMYVDAGLRAHGFTTGLFTSPHIVGEALRATGAQRPCDSQAPGVGPSRGCAQ